MANRNIGASLHGLELNLHTRAHVARAVQEGIVFALNHGMGALREMGLELETIKAGHANMFLSPLFAQAFATVTGATVELYNTDGAQGAARGAGIGAGLYRSMQEAFRGLDRQKTIRPDKRAQAAYKEAYGRWREVLEARLRAQG